MAQVTLRDLLENPRVESVGVADLTAEKANAAAERLNDERAVPVTIDAQDRSSLTQALGDWDVVINSAWYRLNLLVMKAAIKAGVHYVDLGGLYHMTKKQLEIDKEAKDAGVCCVLGMGSSPGIMNVIGAYAASTMDTVETMKLRSASTATKDSNTDLTPSFSIRTILDEFTIPPIILRDGKIQEIEPLTQKETFTMPDPVGQVQGYYTIHSELATMPITIGKGIRNMDFIVTYPPQFTETIALLVRLGLASKTPVTVNGREISPYDLLATVIEAGPKPPKSDLDIDIQRGEAHGTRNGKASTVTMDAICKPNIKWQIGGGTVGTGSSPSIAAQWLASGEIKMRGVLPPETCIDPLPFFKALHDRGIITVETRQESLELI